MVGTILVTGATGTIGREAVRHLVLAKAKVRAGIYNEKEAEKLNFVGAELVHFDFENNESVTSALNGVEKVLLITPFTDRMVDYTRTFIEFAKSAGVKQLVRISMMGADLNSPSSGLRMHAECEQIVMNSGIPYLILRPNWFMQDFLNYATNIKNQGTYRAPINLKGSISFVDVRDVANICALALASDNAVSGTYILTGPQTFTHRQVEDNFAYVLTKRVIFKEMKDEEFRTTMSGYGLSNWQIDALLGLYDEAEKGLFEAIHPTTAEVLGRKPETFKTFIKAYVKEFR
jgi:uncharacterized protein YbjT (DUF2867 family)